MLLCSPTGFIINEIGIKPDFQVLNYKNHDVVEFPHKKKIKKHRNIVVHENAGSTNIDTLARNLLNRNRGYHITIDRGGAVRQHADLTSKLIHGNRLNKWGIGICVINPYYPHLVAGKEGFEIIPSEWWTHGKYGYVLPTQAQLESFRKVVGFLCPLLEVPFSFPTKHLNKKKRKVGILERIDPGIVAHGDYSKHTDGRYPMLSLTTGTCATCGTLM
jgi:hypothetical protein